MRLTRNSFKRKIITAGIAIFATLAISTTGFAAWILSASASKEQEGGVTVGVVDKTQIEISDLSFTDDKKDFLFEPLASDNTGRVRAGSTSENLTVQFTCTINYVSAATNITVTFEQPEWIEAAVTAGYLVAPDLGGSNTVTIKSSEGITSAASLPTGWTYAENTEQDKGTLTCTLTYAWGAVFGGQNPGIYYDENATGKLVSDAEVEETLHSFKAMCHGKSLDEYLTWYESYLADKNVDQLAAPNYKVLINASA